MANTEATEKIYFSVKGMTCGGCIRSVQRILNNVDGILDANVQLGHFAVVVDPARADAAGIQQALRDGRFIADIQGHMPL